MASAPARIALAVLKRADTAAEGVLVAVGLRSVPAGWLCAEASCGSARDTAVHVAFTVVMAAGIAAVVWRTTRRWWTRALALLVAAYASLQLPAWLGRLGRWPVEGDAAVRCVVRAGAGRDTVRRACGAPTYWCEGPKFVESRNPWNPFDLTVCGFQGDVYRDRLVTYDCVGRVARVDGIAVAPPEEWRPQGCVSWGR